MAINKVIFGGNTLIDLTDTTATASDVASGAYFYGIDGVRTAGTNTFDSDTSDDTATVSEILSGKTAHARGTLLTGTMPNRGSVTGTISTKTGQYTIQNGYHDGSGKVSISSTEQAKIIAGNIKSGVSILGVTGTYSGEAINVQTKSVIPTTSSQSVLPDAGYDYLSEVTVSAIPYVETQNAYGTTVTIA